MRKRGRIKIYFPMRQRLRSDIILRHFYNKSSLINQQKFESIPN